MVLAFFDSPVKLSVFTFLCVAIILILSKPRIFFNEEGELKSFGCEQGATLFSLPVCLYWSAVLITFIFEYLYLKNSVS